MLVDHSKTGNYSYTAVGSVSNRTGIYPLSQVRLEMDLYRTYRTYVCCAKWSMYLSSTVGSVSNRTGIYPLSQVRLETAPTEQCEKWISIALLNQSLDRTYRTM